MVMSVSCLFSMGGSATGCAFGDVDPGDERERGIRDVRRGPISFLTSCLQRRIANCQAKPRNRANRSTAHDGRVVLQANPPEAHHACLLPRSQGRFRREQIPDAGPCRGGHDPVPIAAGNRGREDRFTEEAGRNGTTGLPFSQHFRVFDIVADGRVGMRMRAAGRSLATMQFSNIIARNESRLTDHGGRNEETPSPPLLFQQVCDP